MATKKPDKIELPPQKGIRHFVFHACLVEQKGNQLTLTVPKKALQWRGARVDARGHSAWTQSSAFDAKEVDIACAGKAQARQDGGGYPKAQSDFDGVKFVFTGATSFGRVLQGGASKLVVQAQVESIAGLPKGTNWSGFESIELTGGKLKPVDKPAPRSAKAPVLADLGGGNGPHQPYP